MSRKIHTGLALSVFALLASGCVSTGKFEEMQASKDAEIKQLQDKNALLNADYDRLDKLNLALQREKADLEGERSNLVEQRSDLQQQNMAAQEQVGSLEKEKAELLAASQQRQQQYDALVTSLSQQVEKGQLQVRQYKDMMAVDLAEQIFFDSGKATLKSAGKEVLKSVADALKGYESKNIRVVGHTDNVPITATLSATFPTNWELSVARATTVVRFLQDAGISPERLTAAGKGEFDPVASNDTPEGRQKNRRIEILLIDSSLEDEMHQSDN